MIDLPSLLFLHSLFAAFLSGKHFDSAQLATTADFRYKSNCFSDMGSGLPVEAVAIAAELKKGRSRTRAFPIHRANRVHKSLHNGCHHHFQFGPHLPVTPLLWA